VSVLPVRAARAWARLEPIGLFVIIGLLAAGLLDDVMQPIVRFGEWILQTLLGL
jgi:hypothetical protein